MVDPVLRLPSPKFQLYDVILPELLIAEKLIGELTQLLTIEKSISGAVAEVILTVRDDNADKPLVVLIAFNSITLVPAVEYLIVGDVVNRNEGVMPQSDSKINCRTRLSTLPTPNTKLLPLNRSTSNPKKLGSPLCEINVGTFAGFKSFKSTIEIVEDSLLTTPTNRFPSGMIRTRMGRLKVEIEKEVCSVGVANRSLPKLI